MDWICNAINRIWPLDSHSRDGLPRAGVTPEELAIDSNLLSPCEWNGSTANRERFSITLRQPKSVRCCDPRIYPTGAIFLARLGTAFGWQLALSSRSAPSRASLPFWRRIPDIPALSRKNISARDADSGDRMAALQARVFRLVGVHPFGWHAVKT